MRRSDVSRFDFDDLLKEIPGDVKGLGGSVSELRIDYGPGYRVYFTRRSSILIFLLAGGDKKTQQRDIALALSLADRDIED